MDFLNNTPLEYTRDLFFEHPEKAKKRPGQFVALLGYPQASQMYLYFGVCGPVVLDFILENTPKVRHVDWSEVQRQQFISCKNLVRVPLSAKDVSVKMTALLAILAPLMPLGLQSADVFSLMTGFWGARLGVEGGTICGPVTSCAPFTAFGLTEFVTLRCGGLSFSTTYRRQ